MSKGEVNMIHPHGHNLDYPIFKSDTTARLLGRLEAKVDAVHEDVREIKENTRDLETRTRGLERTAARGKGAMAVVAAAMTGGLTWLGLD